MDEVSKASDGSSYSLQSRYTYHPQTVGVSFQLEFIGTKPMGSCVSNLPGVQTTTADATTTTITTTTTTTTPPSTTEPPTTTAAATTISPSTTGPSTTTSQVTTVSQTSSTVQPGTHTVVPVTFVSSWNENGQRRMSAYCEFTISSSLQEFNMLIELNKQTSDLIVRKY